MEIDDDDRLPCADRPTYTGKPLQERAEALLHTFLHAGLMPGAEGDGGEQLARETVRWLRALDSESVKPT
jgi:hypothetical protein